MYRKPIYRLVLFAVCIAFAIGIFTNANHAQGEGAAIRSIDEPAEASGGGAPASRRYNSTAKGSEKVKTTRRAPPARVASVNVKPKRWDGFVIGDKYTFMNFEVISAAKPYHTRAAKAGGASGLVQVEVLIGTDGGVLTARARTGNKLLHPEAERAALASKFNRPAVYGKPARAIGFLVYRFGAAEEEE